MININLDVLCYLQIFNFKSENLNIVYFKLYLLLKNINFSKMY